MSEKRPVTIAVQLYVTDAQHDVDNPLIIQSFAKDLKNGDDLGLELCSMGVELCDRLQKSGWGDMAAERVIVGPSPVRLVK